MTSSTPSPAAAEGRPWSLAYLTAFDLTAPAAIRLAADLGYGHVGLRPYPNGAGAPCQALIDSPPMLRETLAAQRDTGVTVFDLEIIRIGPDFTVADYEPMMAVGQQLGARAVLVAADDTDPARLADRYALLCERLAPFGLTGDLEFMPWTAVRNAADALATIDRAGRPANAGILVDALHFGRSDTTLAEIAALPRELLHYAQICDATVRAPGAPPFTDEQLIHTARCERLLPGEGEIDLAGLFAALPSDLPVSVEIVHLERMAKLGTPEWARLSIEAGRRVIEKG